jgi:hypothetical protein
MSSAKAMCDVFNEAKKVCDEGTFKYPYISGARIKYKTLSVCDSPYKGALVPAAVAVALAASRWRGVQRHRQTPCNCVGTSPHNATNHVHMLTLSAGTLGLRAQHITMPTALSADGQLTTPCCVLPNESDEA